MGAVEAFERQGDGGGPGLEGKAVPLWAEQSEESSGAGAVAEGAGCEGMGVPAGVGMKETSWKMVEGQRLSDEERAADLSAPGYGSREGIFLYYLLLLICQLYIDPCPALS